MSAALAGALATAKAANPGAKTAAAHAREGQATTARSKKWIGAASRRSAQAALEASSRQARGKSRPVEAPSAPLPPRGFEPRTSCTRRRRSLHSTTSMSRTSRRSRDAALVMSEPPLRAGSPAERSPKLGPLQVFALVTRYYCGSKNTSFCLRSSVLALAAKERSMDRTNSCAAAVYCHRGDKQPSLRCSSLFGDSLVSFSPKQHHSTHRSSGGSLQFCLCR